MHTWTTINIKEEEEEEFKKQQYSIPGGHWSPHACTSVPFPTQYAPPRIGSGLEQVRFLICVPMSAAMSHDRVHCDHGVQFPQFPSAVNEYDISFCLIDPTQCLNIEIIPTAESNG